MTAGAAAARRTLPSEAGPPLAPLYLAGFTTAFGAHSVAAVLGNATGEGSAAALLGLAFTLAVYDLAEVVLKPVFGTLTDRIGPKPVIVAGLVGFAAASLVGAIWTASPALLAVRFAQGAAASAFSPASSAAVTRLAPPGTFGRYFGRYGSWKSLGYALGPLLGAALVTTGGFGLLSAALALVAAVAAVWVQATMRPLTPLPRPRATLLDVLRESTSPVFLRPTLVLAAAAGVLVTAIGFLPAIGAHLGLNIFLTTGAASVLAVTASLTQPAAGRALDSGRLTERAGMAAGLLLAAAGVALAALATGALTAGVLALYAAALLVGVGVGCATPIAFAALARTTPAERVGRTMGTAELGRELGDAGAPALVGLLAVPFGLGGGLTGLALITGLIGLGTVRGSRTSGTRDAPDERVERIPPLHPLAHAP